MVVVLHRRKGGAVLVYILLQKKKTVTVFVLKGRKPTPPFLSYDSWCRSDAAEVAYNIVYSNLSTFLRDG